MLTITIPEQELFNEETCEFIMLKGQTLVLEHSLAAIAEWESKWKKSFLSTQEKTNEETLDYINCMIVNKEETTPISYIDNNNMQLIANYIADTMTATTINNRNHKPHSREIITAEIIYYWMVSLQIPFECQYWHLNRLMTLINVCSIKNQGPQKMNAHEAAKQQADLNAARRAKLKSKG